MSALLTQQWHTDRVLTGWNPVSHNEARRSGDEQVMCVMGQLAMLPSVLAAAPPVTGAYQNTNVELVFGILLFIFTGFMLCIGGLTAGRIVRPSMPHPEKVRLSP